MMESHHHLLMLSSLFLALVLFVSTPSSVATSDPVPTDGDIISGPQKYIIQLRPPANVDTINRGQGLEKWYQSFLPTTSLTANSSSRILHKYSHAITGFAAKLTAAELKEMEKKEGFLKAYPDRLLPLLTTHTPSFLGLQPGNGFWNASSFGKGVIIGMLDTGAQPIHPSFNDHGMPPPPSKWKGECAFGGSVCNNKIIGARAMDVGGSYIPPNDMIGHGTHTATTAAGNFVHNASVLGNGNGTAAGMAPLAHLAIYRVCSPLGCASSAVLAGMDAAIKDGVDIMSLSLGGSDVHEFDDDVIAIGAFAAVEKGIFVSCAAGNSGPEPSTLSNEAPWVLTVGASTTDRSIRSTVKLGDGQEFDGESVFQPENFTSNPLPLIYPSSDDADFLPGNCGSALTLREIGVKGKVVVCDRSLARPRTEIGSIVKIAGAAGMILVNGVNDGYTTLAEAHVLPASHVSYSDGSKIKSYARAAKNPTASIIFKGTVIGNPSAPTVASFSSRGPNQASPGILKPDITGPGVSILAGWPFGIASPSSSSSQANFNIISGTSMATPHLSGIAALIKSVHPDWSPAAIKSAIMTTSDKVRRDGKPITNEQGKPASFYMMGAGHVNPAKAADPGLVYDIAVDDYIAYLCGLGYNDDMIETVARRRVSCSGIKEIGESELNYPSVNVALGMSSVTVNRTVTKVGEGEETYTAKVEMPDGVEVTVTPKELRFSERNEKKSFMVSLKWSDGEKDTVSEGELQWVSEEHVVRTPIVVFGD